MHSNFPKLVPELYCSDVDTSHAFYVGLLGFTVRYDRPDDRFYYLELEGVKIMIEEASENSQGDRTWWTAMPEKPYGRGINFQIEIKDVDELYARLKQAKWPLFRPMEEKWYRAGSREVGNRQFLVQDPDGYLLRFFSDLGERSLNSPAR